MKADAREPFETAAGAVVAPWDPHVDLEEALGKLAARGHVLFLDSALRDPVLGRYSFLTAEPFEYFQLPADGSDGLEELSRRLSPYHSPTIADLPPPDCFPMTWDGRWKNCHARDSTSLIRRRWQSACTTSCWRSIMSASEPG